MALTIYETKQETNPGARIKVDRRLCLNADRDQIVEADDPAAASLYASAGKEVRRDEFEKLGGEILERQEVAAPAAPASKEKSAKKTSAKKKATKKKA